MSTPTVGTQTLLTDPSLRQYFPVDIQINQFNGWITPVDPTDPNVGQERRGSSWAQATGQITLYAPGFVNNISALPHEIHMRFPRALILEAINDAIGQLGLSWYREVRDSTIQTVQYQWRYILPATQFWTTINSVEIQINTDANAVAGGYPFASADYLNPKIERDVTVAGVETWAIQFGRQPPPNRTIRVRGEAYYPDLVLDTDFVSLAGEWTRPALSWIYSWGVFQLQDWTSNVVPTDQTEKVRQKAMDMLERQKNSLLATAPPHKPGKIVTPGQGDGRPMDSPGDWRYLGAFRSLH